MRRFRIIAVSLVLLFAGWLLWRQLVQRRRATRKSGYTPESSLPAWTSAPIPAPDASVVKGTAERTHNQSDALTQAREPVASFAPHASAVSSLTAGTTFGGESPAKAEEEAEAGPSDDLILIEGIGPKISTVVAAAGITTFAELAATDTARLQAILDEAGIHTINPATWPEQARLAAQGKWDELHELQDRIKNGQLET
jgi:predicted flap endonuclease-1-like 5' DNA nuclease